MKKTLTTYLPVLKFIALFFGVYIGLSLVYGLYLNYFSQDQTRPDPATHLVAQQSSWLINKAGYNAAVIPDTYAPHMNLFVENQKVAIVVEGCNAISILILFASFIIAFAKSFKKTLLFILCSISLIYLINIVRIAILAIAIFELPEYATVLHGVVFPGIIYGLVVLLWIYWVRKNTYKPTL